MKPFGLSTKPSAMKLLFGALSATERAYLIMGGEHKTEELWIFTYFDPEAVYKYGYQVVLLQVFHGLHGRMNEIKTRVEKVVRLLEDEDATKKELGLCISHFPMKET